MMSKPMMGSTQNLIYSGSSKFELSSGFLHSFSFKLHEGMFKKYSMNKRFKTKPISNHLKLF